MRTGIGRGLTRATVLRRALAAGLGVPLAAAGACGGTEDAPAAPSTRAPVTLSISTDWSTGIRADTVKRWAEEYPATNPRVKTVEIWTSPTEGGPTAATYNVRVQTAIAAGSGPDVMMEVWNPNPASLLLNLDGHIKQRRLNKADYWWSRYYQEAEDGKVFSLPMGVYVGGMVANVELFERTGAKLPGKDWTFDDLKELARRLKSGSAWGFERQTGAWTQGWTERAAQEGAEWYDRKTLKTTLTTGSGGGRPEDAFAEWWALVWRDRLAPNPEEVAEVRRNAGVSAGMLFASGLIGLSGLPFHQVGLVKEQVAGRFRYQVLWPPKSPYSTRRGYHLETNCVSVNRFTQDRGHPDEAAGLAFYWLSEPLARFMAANLPVVPPARKWHRSKELTDAAPGMELFGDLVDEAQKIGNDRHKWQGGTGASPKNLEWFTAVREKLEQQALVRGGDPRVALREAVAEGDRALA